MHPSASLSLLFASGRRLNRNEDDDGGVVVCRMDAMLNSYPEGDDFFIYPPQRRFC